MTGSLFKVMEGQSKKQGELEQWRRTVDNHFLCALLVSLSCEVMNLEAWLDMQEERLVSALARAAEPRSFISDALVRLAAKIAVDEAVELAKEASHFKNFQRAPRLSAILSCPEPREHEAVLNCCVIPVEKGVISDEVKQELLQPLPTQWRAASA